MFNIFSTGDEAEAGAPNILQVGFFNALQILGFVLLIAVLCPALLSRTIHRSRTWFCLISSWIVYCLSFIVLIGKQLGPEPGFDICLVQAGLIYAALPLTAFAGLSFLIEIYRSLSPAFSQDKGDDSWMIFLVLLPPIIGLIVFVEALVLGLRNPDSVRRDPTHMYCHINSGMPTAITGILVTLALVAIIYFEVLTSIILYRNWVAFGRLACTRSVSTVLPTMFIRIGMFMFIPMLALGLSAYDFHKSKESNPKWNILVAALPAMAALAFGTQMDILRAWMVWKKNVAFGSESHSRDRV